MQWRCSTAVRNTSYAFKKEKVETEFTKRKYIPVYPCNIFITKKRVLWKINIFNVQATRKNKKRNETKKQTTIQQNKIKIKEEEASTRKKSLCCFAVFRCARKKGENKIIIIIRKKNNNNSKSKTEVWKIARDLSRRKNTDVWFCRKWSYPSSTQGLQTRVTHQAGIIQSL